MREAVLVNWAGKHRSSSKHGHRSIQVIKLVSFRAGSRIHNNLVEIRGHFFNYLFFLLVNILMRHVIIVIKPQRNFKYLPWITEDKIHNLYIDLYKAM